MPGEMSVLGLVGIILGLFAIPLAFTQPTRLKIVYMTGMYFMHVAACFVYFWLAKTSIADSYEYYYDNAHYYDDGFSPGSQAIVYITQYIRFSFGGTYLDLYLLYQATGFFGIAILVRIFEEIYDELKLPHRPYLYLLVALPSLHFWSSALGKDAPFLLAVSLAIWATMRLPKRTKALLGALLLMLIIRPQIAIVASAALSLAAMVGRGIPTYARVGLFLGAAVGVAVATSTLQSTYGIDITSSESISTQFERRDMVLQSSDAGTTAADGGFAFRLFSLMFRPLFFDANELFAWLASFESVFLIFVVAMLVRRSRELIGLFRTVFFARYAMIFAFGMTMLLAVGYWNVGLGLRQKWTMLIPMYLVLLVAVLAIRLARKGVRTAVMPGLALDYPGPGRPRPALR